MVLKTIVVIGSRNYRYRILMEKVLNKEILNKYGNDFVIMSGKCPEEDSVDNWAISWATKHNYLVAEIPPRAENTERFFERNEQMAHYADEIIAFVPKDQFRSGVRNCIKYFRQMDKTNYRIFDESGKEWDWKWSSKK